MTSLREFRNSLIKVIVWVGIIMTPLNGMLFELIFRDLFFRTLIFLAGNVDMFVPWSMAFWTSLPKKSEETNASSCPNFPANKWESLRFFWKVSNIFIIYLFIFCDHAESSATTTWYFFARPPKMVFALVFFFSAFTQIYQRQSIGTSATPNGALLKLLISIMGAKGDGKGGRKGKGKPKGSKSDAYIRNGYIERPKTQ